MANWLGPSDGWPSHPYPEAQRALEAARHAGWWLKAAGSSAHIYGVIHCRRTSGQGYCRFAVYTTGGSDREETAHRIRDKLAKCQHQQEDLAGADDVAQETLPARALRAANVHMDRAERLLGATEHLLTYQEMRGRAEALIDQAAADAGQADRLLAEAQALDEAAAISSETARHEADAADMASEPWPPPEEGLDARLVGPAETGLQTASTILHGAVGEPATAARTRLDGLQERLESCRSRVARLGN